MFFCLVLCLLLLHTACPHCLPRLLSLSPISSQYPLSFPILSFLSLAYYLFLSLPLALSSVCFVSLCLVMSQWETDNLWFCFSRMLAGFVLPRAASSWDLITKRLTSVFVSPHLHGCASAPPTRLSHHRDNKWTSQHRSGPWLCRCCSCWRAASGLTLSCLCKLLDRPRLPQRTGEVVAASLAEVGKASEFCLHFECRLLRFLLFWFGSVSVWVI